MLENSGLVVFARQAVLGLPVLIVWGWGFVRSVREETYPTTWHRWIPIALLVLVFMHLAIPFVYFMLSETLFENHNQAIFLIATSAIQFATSVVSALCWLCVLGAAFGRVRRWEETP